MEHRLKTSRVHLDRGLVLVMFWLELDVTLAKIEDIPNHFVGWTSSVFVAFALPDLYFLASRPIRVHK